MTCVALRNVSFPSVWSVCTMTDTSLLSFEVDVLYMDVSDDVSCDGLATLVMDNDPQFSGTYNTNRFARRG